MEENKTEQSFLNSQGFDYRKHIGRPLDVHEFTGNQLIDLLSKFKQHIIDTAAPVKTLQECKDRIAQEWQYNTWESLRTGFTSPDGLQFVDNRANEAAEMYADQFKSPVKLVTDEEIEAKAKEIAEPFGSRQRAAVKIAKWMQKQLTGKL